MTAMPELTPEQIASVDLAAYVAAQFPGYQFGAHHIAIIENVPLARALYATAELNREIPPELYNAVAEVLVYLYRMDEKLK